MRCLTAALVLIALSGCSMEPSKTVYVVKAQGKSWNTDPGSLHADRHCARFTVNRHVVLVTSPYAVEEATEIANYAEAK